MPQLANRLAGAEVCTGAIVPASHRVLQNGCYLLQLALGLAGAEKHQPRVLCLGGIVGGEHVQLAGGGVGALRQHLVALLRPP
eukprot:6093155-Pyramimonas_sp.AAC.2